MSNTLQVKRGSKASLPTLNAGELGFCTDTHDIYIGDGAANHQLITYDIFSAKGDILGASADNTPVILSAGTNGYVLAANSAQASGLEWISAGTPSSHKDSHDPNDGADPLDTASAAEISTVVAAGVGTSHSFSRADHIHAINHSISNNHIVTIDGTTNQPVSSDYAMFTTNGLEGLSKSQVLSDLSVESGADVTDATNVANAGAVMEGDTSTSSMSFVLDEDDMNSNSATKLATQQSIRAYAIANSIKWALVFGA
jgi:hypothetical protein